MGGKRKRIVIGLAVFVGVCMVIVGAAVATPQEPSYRFVTVDHPVDMWADGIDKWSYFSIGEGSTADLAKKVREELGPRGFVEDTTRKPWFVFSKGSEQVVVCNHNEFEVNGSLHGSKLAFNRMWKKYAGKEKGWPCILVKNGPGTSEPLYAFQIKKLVHGW